MKKLFTILAIASVVLLAGCKKDDYVAIDGGLCPVVVSVTPKAGAVFVGRSNVVSSTASAEAARTTLVTATFNKKMDPRTINESTFTVKVTGSSAVVGTVSYTDSTATFTASAKFPDNKTFEARITTGAKDKMGNALQTDYVWSFSTGLTILPIISTTSPTANETNVALNKTITVAFSMPMDQLSITATTFTLNNGVTPVLGLVSGTGNNSQFVPNVALSPNTVYTAKITMAAKNTDGSTLAKDTTWTFTTSSAFALNIIAVNGSVLKVPALTSYAIGANVVLTATANTGFVFSGWSGDASGSANPLTITMNSAKNITANFTAAGGIGNGPGMVDLKSAAFFTVLSKSGISTTGVSSITGNIGVSPGTATLITGFGQIMNTDGQSSHTPIVIGGGNVYASDYAVPTPTKMTTAITDMEGALTSAMGMTTNVIVELGAGNISGMTLAPGLYKWGTGLDISNVGVTLNGGPNDTWVFQIAQGLTVANTAIIHLTGGAQAKNIFWVTAKDAIIGTTVDFSGNILSQTLISLKSGSKVTGRLLAQTAVTLDGATVVLP